MTAGNELRSSAVVTVEDLAAYGAALRRDMLLPRFEAIGLTAMVLAALYGIFAAVSLVAPQSATSYGLGVLARWSWPQ